MKFKDAVYDSYQHFMKDLGIVPTIDDIFGDLERDNYELEDEVKLTLDEYYYEIKSILDSNQLEYKS